MSANDFLPCRGPHCRFTAPVCAWGFCGKCCRQHHTLAIIGESAVSHVPPVWGVQGFIIKELKALPPSRGTGKMWDAVKNEWVDLSDEDTRRCKCGWLFHMHPRPTCKTPMEGTYDSYYGRGEVVDSKPEPKVPEPGAFEVVTKLEFPIEVTEHGYVKGF